MCQWKSSFTPINVFFSLYVATCFVSNMEDLCSSVKEYRNSADSMVQAPQSSNTATFYQRFFGQSDSEASWCLLKKCADLRFNKLTKLTSQSFVLSARIQSSPLTEQIDMSVHCFGFFSCKRQKNMQMEGSEFAVLTGTNTSIEVPAAREKWIVQKPVLPLGWYLQKFTVTDLHRQSCLGHSFWNWNNSAVRKEVIKGWTDKETKERNTVWWTFREEERNHSNLRSTHIWCVCVPSAFIWRSRPDVCGNESWVSAGGLGCQVCCLWITSRDEEAITIRRSGLRTLEKIRSAENVSNPHLRLVMSLARSENGTSCFQHMFQKTACATYKATVPDWTHSVKSAPDSDTDVQMSELL